MKQAYPVVMTQGKNHIIVFVPDFEINTQGKDYAEAMEMARDAIGIMGIDMEDDNEPLPSPTGLDAVRSGAAEGAVISLVDVDFGEYRRKNDLRAVKKNCTIPSWLNFEAEKAGINFSSLLQAAIKRELKIENK